MGPHSITAHVKQEGLAHYQSLSLLPAHLFKKGRIYDAVEETR